jgi:hypothetical protein
MAQEENPQDEEQDVGRVTRSPRFDRMTNISGGEGDSIVKKPKLTGAAKTTVSLTVFMICFTIAIFGDLVGAAFNLLPGLGGMLATILITPIGAVNTLALSWTSGKKLTGKSLAIIIGCIGIECVPILNVLPGLTTSVVMTKFSQVADETVTKITKLD